MLVLLNRIKRILLLFFTLFALSFYVVEKPISPALAYDTIEGLSFEITEIVDGNVKAQFANLNWKEVTIKVTNNSNLQLRYGYANYSKIVFRNDLNDSAYYELPGFRNGHANIIEKGVSQLRVFVYLANNIESACIDNIVYLGDNGQPIYHCLEVPMSPDVTIATAFNSESINAYCTSIECEEETEGIDSITHTKHVTFCVSSADETISLKGAYLIATNVFGEEVIVDLPERDFAGPVVAIGDETTIETDVITYEAIFTLPDQISTMRILGPMVFNGKTLSIDMISKNQIDLSRRDYKLFFQADHVDIIDGRIKTMHLSLKNNTIFNVIFDPVEGSNLNFYYNDGTIIKTPLGKAVKIRNKTTEQFVVLLDIPANVAHITLSNMMNDKLVIGGNMDNTWANFDVEVCVYREYSTTPTNTYNICGISGNLESINVDQKKVIKSVTFHLISEKIVNAYINSSNFIKLYNGDDEVLSLPFSFDHSGYEIFDFDCKYIVEIGWNLSFVEFNRAFITVTPFEDIIGDDPITIELNLEGFEVKSAEGVEPGIIYVDPQVDNNQKNNVVPLYVIIPFAVIGGIVVIFVLVFAIMKLVKKNKRGI